MIGSMIFLILPPSVTVITLQPDVELRAHIGIKSGAVFLVRVADGQ